MTFSNIGWKDKMSRNFPNGQIWYHLQSNTKNILYLRNLFIAEFLQINISSEAFSKNPYLLSGTPLHKK